MKKPLFFLPVLFLLTAFTLYGQEIDLNDIGIPEPAQEQKAPSDENRIYIISDFEFDIKGHTRPDALIYNGEFHKGEKIRGDTNLDKYIRGKTQLLINQRVLKDNVEIGRTIGEQEADGSYPVTLIIKVEDSWNLIALPYPKYNSNTGFELIIKARDYNFLGTMNPLRIDFGYRYDENHRSSFLIEIDSNTPFKAFGYNWNIDFDHYFNYRPQVEEPYYYKNVSGISMELPFRATTFTFGLEESFIVNEENSDRFKENHSEYGDFQNGLYMSTRLYTYWKIPTGIEVSRYGELTYTPEISATFNHEMPKWELHPLRNGPFLHFNHSFGFEKVDWHSNYREGLSVWLTNKYTYDFYRLNNNVEPLSVYFAAEGTGYFIISEYFGITSRLKYRHWFYHDPEYFEQAGDILRGIADKAMCADYMLSLNADFPLRVLVFTPSKWFNNRKLGFFDFEFQISPVIDMALYHDPKANVSFSPDNIAVSGGLEFIIYPAFMRNLYVCLSLGWNLRELATAKPVRLPGGENREITFGIGLFY